eukprot:12678219-Alexandrium_andersonii.AAC.1
MRRSAWAASMLRKARRKAVRISKSGGEAPALCEADAAALRLERLRRVVRAPAAPPRQRWKDPAGCMAARRC